MAARKRKVAKKAIIKKGGRRSYLPAFKAKVLKYIEGGHTQAEASREFDVHATVIMGWRMNAAKAAKAAKKKAPRKKAKRKVRRKVAKRKQATVETLAHDLAAHCQATDALVKQRRAEEAKIAQRITDITVKYEI